MKSNYHGLRPSSNEHDRGDEEIQHEEQELLNAATEPGFGQRRQSLGLRSLALVGMLCLGGGLAFGYLAGNRHHEGQMMHMHGHHHAQELDSDDCSVAPSRREWSTFNLLEKSDYLRAVRALIYSPSVAGSNGTLYDDFPYVRAEFGRQSKCLRTDKRNEVGTAAKDVILAIGASSFLPWNRYFLHSYEKKLREKGGYKGSLP